MLNMCIYFEICVFVSIVKDETAAEWKIEHAIIESKHQSTAEIKIPRAMLKTNTKIKSL